MKLYSEESSNPKWNAQRNLSGRTHYVDEDTLRFHKSRVLSTHIADQGLLFALVESVALDMNNTRRVVRYVIFNIFGEVIGKRANLEDCFRTRKQATKAMWDEINSIDAKFATFDAIARARKAHDLEMDSLVVKVKALDQKAAA